ncbi:MAG: rhomboid family intramembrane serine protease [Hyphomicrobiales bacterium]
MFLPLADKNPLKIISFQYATVTIIALNLVNFFLYEVIYTERIEMAANYAYGVIPAVLFDTHELGPHLSRVPGELTLLTYQFFHGDWMHLIANMAFLWVFGDNVEDSLGHFRFLVFYILSGIAAGLTFALMAPASTVPLIGASGAVAGVLAAYMLLHPKQQVWVLLFMRIPVPLPALWAIVAWIGFQVFSLFTQDNNAAVAVAWWAHIGGFVAGLVLLVILAPSSLRRNAAAQEQ